MCKWIMAAVFLWGVCGTAIGFEPPGLSDESLRPRNGPPPPEWEPAEVRPEPGDLGTPFSAIAEGDTEALLGTADEAGPVRWLGDILVTDSTMSRVEPAMTSTPDGVLFIAVESYGAMDGWVTVYRSIDGGAHWQVRIHFKTGVTARNPALTYAERASGEKWLFLVYEATLADGTKSIMAIRFDPDTLDWTPTTAVSGLTAAPDIHPAVCTDNLIYDVFYVYIAYTVNAIDNFPVMFVRSLDYGLTYSTPQNITGGSEASSHVARPDIAYGTAGLFVVFEKPGWTGSTWATQVWLAKSSNFGGTWATPVQLTSNTQGATRPAVVAAIGSPTILAAYTYAYTSDTDVHYSYSTDGGSSFSADQTMPWTWDNEDAVALCASTSAGRFHGAFWRDYDIVYTWADVATPNVWATATVLNEANWASGTNRRPAICVDPTRAITDQACVAWTDYRGPLYDIYFDASFRRGACCALDSMCSETTEAACAAVGGRWMGEGSTCDAYICLYDPCEDDLSAPLAVLTLGDFQCVAANTSTPVYGTANDPDGNLDTWRLEERGMSSGTWILVAAGSAPVNGGLFANWLPAAPGYRMLRLTVEDKCGHATSAERLMHADAGPYAAINTPLSGSVVGGTAVCIDGIVGHGVCGISWDLAYRPVGGAWVTLATGTSSVHNLPLAHWNTTTVPDGSYQLRLRNASIGGTTSVTIPVTIDNTLPVAVLDEPLNCVWVDGTVQIYGVAADTNLTQWDLQWTGGESNLWNTIATGHASLSGLLAEWDVSALPNCAYTLRLVVRDAAKLNCTNDVHWREYLVSLRVGLPGTDADLDGDGDIDMHDFAIFALSFTGPE